MNVRTKANTEFLVWWKAALTAFADRNLREPLYGETRDAYDMGESPETWADYVRFDPDWNKEAVK